MKKILIPLFALCAACTALAQTPSGKQELTRFAPAASRAVVVMDAKHLQDARDVGPVIKRFFNTEDLERGARKLAFFVGSDLRNDLYSMMMASTGGEKPSEISVVHAKLDHKRLVEFFNLAEGVTTEKYGDTVLHKIPDEKNHKIQTAAFLGEALLAIGSEDAVKRAVDIYANKKHADEKTSATLIAFRSLSKDAFLRIAVADPTEFPGEKDPIQQQLKNIFITATADGGMDITLQADAPTAEVAGQIKSVLDGLLAMAKLQAGLDKNTAEDAMKALNEAQVSVKEKTLNCKIRVPKSALEEAAEKKEDKPAPKPDTAVPPQP